MSQKMKKIILSLSTIAVVGLLIFSAYYYHPVNVLMREMTLEEKINQMMMISFRYWDDVKIEEGDKTALTVMNEDVKEIVENYHFGSIIYFAQNLKETAQAHDLTLAFQEASMNGGGIPLLICADQEGGIVFRLKSGTALPGNMALGATDDPKHAKQAGQIIGSELHALGINANLAPVVDVNNNANNPVIGLRSFSDDPELVGSMASALMKGVAEYDVISCAKHFPGHGDTGSDSHYSLPIVDKTYEELKECELAPFEICIEEGVDMIMTSHILYPALESDKLYSKKTKQYESLPATMSDDILTGLLKEEMGFEGIIVTDAMNMKGITDYWQEAEAIIYAIQAGADLICMPTAIECPEDLETLDDILEEIKEAVLDGTISEERIDDAVYRILKVKHQYGILKYDASDYPLEKAMEVVGGQENRTMERDLSAAAVTVVENKNNVLPLKLNSESKILMAVPYDNELGLMAMGFNRVKEAGLVPNGAEVKIIQFDKESTLETFKEELEWANIIIMNSEVSSPAMMNGGRWVSSYLYDVIEYANEHGQKIIIQSVDKPYDVQSYPNADVVLAVYGCQGTSLDPTLALIENTVGDEMAYGPNIIAGIEVMFGLCPAEGSLPIDIPRFYEGAYMEEIIYPRGHGITYEKVIVE